VSRLEQEVGGLWAEARIVGQRRLRGHTGAEIEVELLDPVGIPLFTVFHHPARPPHGIVLMISPPFAEAIRNQRRELLFALLTADQGLAAVRFHARGSGHSGGEAVNLTLDTMQHDAEEVAMTACDRFDAPIVGVIGTRLGAVVAHRVANSRPQAGIAWWSPVLNAGSYMRELSRANRIGGLKQGITSQPAGADPLEDGILDVLGSPVSLEFRRSLFARPLDDVPGDPRHLLLVQMSRRRDLKSEYSDVLSSLRSRGWSAESLLIQDEETWWFGARGRGQEYELRSKALQVVPATVAFFSGLAASLRP